MRATIRPFLVFAALFGFLFGRRRRTLLLWHTFADIVAEITL